MKKLYTLFLFIMFFSFGFVKSQTNLILNPSFEDTVACPTSQGMPQDAQGWSSFGNSPDYYNACASISSYASLPTTQFGYQQASTGNAMMGIQCFFTPGYREFFGRQLLSPLTVGQKYYVSLKVNCARGGLGSTTKANCACNKIGVLFSTFPYSISNNAPVNNFAHIYTDSVIVDTVNWIAINGSFIADSAYNFIALGNFFDDTHTVTDTFHVNTNYCRAYYYFDDICITTDSSQGCNFTMAIPKNDVKITTVYPNPTDNILYTRTNTPLINSIRIINFSSNVIYEEKNINTVNGLFSIPTNQYPQGFYFIEVTTSEKTWTEKFIINH